MILTSFLDGTPSVTDSLDRVVIEIRGCASFIHSFTKGLIWLVGG